MGLQPVRVHLLVAPILPNISKETLIYSVIARIAFSRERSVAGSDVAIHNALIYMEHWIASRHALLAAKD